VKIIDKKFGFSKLFSYLYYVIKVNDMRTNNEKSIKYLSENPIVKAFIDKVNAERKERYKDMNWMNGKTDLVVEIGNKFIRLWDGSSCWGFISRVDGDLKGAPIKKGDLLKPATWKAPAKHSRGNIIDGTARYTEYGPAYLS
jgi:hypothetical protein